MHNCKKDEPEGYLQWHEWARKKSKTHKQSQCSCGLWSVWTKKMELNDESKDDDYLTNCLLIANAMKIPATVGSVDGDQLVFVKLFTREEQFLPSIDMDQNMRVFNWLCDHGTVTFSGNKAQLVLEDEILESLGTGKGLFRQQLIIDLAVKLASTFEK